MIIATMINFLIKIKLINTLLHKPKKTNKKEKTKKTKNSKET